MSSNLLDLSSEDQLAAYKDLLQSLGWKLLKAHADHDWGPAGYGVQMQRALASIPQGPDRAYELARVAEQVDATAKAVNALIEWPEQAVKLLAPEKPSRQPFAGLRRMGR